MAAEFELLTATDKPALLAITNPELLSACRQALEELGYKVHSVASHTDFLTRFSQISYQIVILDELFDSCSPGDNRTLATHQSMPMHQPRHEVCMLFAPSYPSLTPLQAFQQSVHASINHTDTGKLGQIIRRWFRRASLYSGYRDAQLRRPRASERFEISSINANPVARGSIKRWSIADSVVPGKGSVRRRNGPRNLQLAHKPSDTVKMDDQLAEAPNGASAAVATSSSGPESFTSTLRARLRSIWAPPRAVSRTVCARGAATGLCRDVGQGQLAWKLRRDPAWS